LVDELLSASESSVTLGESVSLDLKSTKWRGELEWPEEVVGFLELWSAGGDLVDQVLHTGDSVLAELTSDDRVVGQWDSASVDLSVSSLVNELGDGGSGWETVSHEWLNDSNHVPGGLVELDEHSVVQLSQSEELQDLLWLRGELVDTK
jgi:hypothetical protein